VPHHGGILTAHWAGQTVEADPQSSASMINRYQTASLADLPPVPNASPGGTLPLHIQIETDQNESGLGPVYLGPSATIRAFAARQSQFVALVQSLMPMALSFGLIASLFLIFFSSTPLRYFYFLLCLLFNVLFEFEPSIRIFGTPIHPFISYVGDTYLLVLFMTGSHWWNGPKVERRQAVVLAGGIAACLAILDLWFGLDAPQTNLPRILLFSTPAVAIAILTSIRAVQSLRHSKPMVQIAIAFATLVYSAFLLNLVRLYFPAETTILFTVHFMTKAMGALAVAGLAGSALAYEFETYRKARQQVQTLSAIAAGHHLALDDQARALKSEIERLAILEERQRFTRDMHDGIGGQLLSMLLKARSGTIDARAMADDLANSINDLRMVTASLDASDGDLHDALGGFAVRIGDQLKTAGIALDWQADRQTDAITLPPRSTLEMLRVIQEAVTNAIRHADATRVAIVIGQSAEGADFSVSIIDDGKGLPDNWQERMGAGIRNMRERAARLGGGMTIAIAASGRGTIVAMTIPYLANAHQGRSA
jgi:signal transduction histidine kinase